MPNISFQLTTQQIRDRSKTVTRRLGWSRLRAGAALTACVKCQGLKKGESVERLARLRVVSVRRERLDAIDQADVIAEGFPGMTPAEFVSMFTTHMRCTPETLVTRIEFEYVHRIGRQLSLLPE